MTAYRFTLEPYKTKATRYDCPECNGKKSFTRYINTETGDHLADHVGKCDRLDNCGYHYPPKMYFQDNPITKDYEPARPFVNAFKPKAIEKPTSFVSQETFIGSFKGYDRDNYFVSYLLKLFGGNISEGLISRYNIGTSKHWPGATVFWQMDANGKIRTGKIMLYDPATGKRIKEPYHRITWVHTALKLPEFNLQQCFFGEHQLTLETTKPVAVVESEKTAIIASVYLPQFIWLAAGSKDGLTKDKCQVLKGRKVILYPDIKAFNRWSEKTKELLPIAEVNLSDLLETKATEAEREQGLDLADYLIRFGLKEFANTGK